MLDNQKVVGVILLDPYIYIYTHTHTHTHTHFLSLAYLLVWGLDVICNIPFYNLHSDT